MSTKWYTSDQHFFHANILKYCNRPWETVEEMNEALIENHNKVVKPNDDVYMLGDFCFRFDQAMDIVPKLNGNLHLIIGNHDHKKLLRSHVWSSAQHYKEIRDCGKRIILFHYPIASWNGMRRGAVHLHGHCHGNLKKLPDLDDHHGSSKQIFDIGVDCWNYRPVTLEEVLGNV